jgi:TonB family protein
MILGDPARLNEKRLNSRGFIISGLVHVSVLAFLLWQPHPFVKPILIAKGTNGKSIELIYLPSNSAPLDNSQERQSVPKPKKKSIRKPVIKAPVAKEETAGAAVEAAKAGSEYGSQLYGLTTGHELKPALPVAGDRPVITKAELPDGVQGDVIVEITIDAQGRVVQTKVLKHIGYGIEEKVIASLQLWQFTPATQDGKPIPSQQDVYFHFPR